MLRWLANDTARDEPRGRLHRHLRRRHGGFEADACTPRPTSSTTCTARRWSSRSTGSTSRVTTASSPAIRSRRTPIPSIRSAARRSRRTPTRRPGAAPASCAGVHRHAGVRPHRGLSHLRERLDGRRRPDAHRPEPHLQPAGPRAVDFRGAPVRRGCSTIGSTGQRRVPLRRQVAPRRLRHAAGVRRDPAELQRERLTSRPASPASCTASITSPMRSR